MARRKAPVEPVSDGLPAVIAAGPDVEVWCPPDFEFPWWAHEETRDLMRVGEARRAWEAAGNAWGTSQGLRGREWRQHLPPEVRYALSALGRSRIYHGDMIAPWDDPSRSRRTILRSSESL